MNSRRSSSVGGLKRTDALIALPIGNIQKSGRGAHFGTKLGILQLGGFWPVTGIARSCSAFLEDVASVAKYRVRRILGMRWHL